jgi:cell fate regulator YaaT (PSP1 superfamily)
MPRVIGVRFERSGKVFYFDPGDLEVGLMDRVVVETDDGPETATVAIAPEQMVYIEVKGPLKPVLRKASEDSEESKESAS